MKFSVKLIAATLCAAMLCVPALAAVSATGAGAYVPNPQYTVISGTVAHQKDGGLLMSTSTGEPTEDYILWTEGVAILDAVSGEPVDAKSIKDGSTVYAWLGAQTAVAMSLPPQVTPELLLVNVPADYKVPQYDVIVRSDGLTGLGIPNRSGMSVTLSDGTVYQVWQDAQVKPYLTRNRVTYQDLLPGTRVLVWADDKGQASKIIVFPYEYKGSVSLDGYGRLFYNKVERLIAVNRDDDRKNLSRLVLRTCIELLAEVHDIDSLRTQCGTNRGRRIGGTTFDLQFNKCSNLFCHSFPWLIILFQLV